MQDDTSDKEVQEAVPELNLDIDDSRLNTYIDNFERQALKFYNEEKHIDKRRETIQRFFFGDQVQGRTYQGLTQTRQLKSYEKPYVDNVLKEGEDILRSIVLSRMPDLVVNPGTQSQLPKETANLLGKAVNKTLQSDELKKILTKAFRHHPLNITACIKWKRNPKKGKLGDIDFEVVHHKNIIMDHKSTDNDEKNMKIIIQKVEKSLNDWIILFPKKEEDLKNYAKNKKDWDEKKDPDGLAIDLVVREVWLEWKDKAEDFDQENPEFDFKSGVLWKLGKGEDAVILDKRLNPNWDWEGEEKLFFNDQPVPEEMIPQLALLGFDAEGVERKKVYRNYFGRPRKPFIFMGYEQYGDMPLDETSRIEENLYLQENYDVRGMQITKMIDDAKGKNVYSSLSGLKKDTVQDNDFNDPDKDMFLTGKLNEVHTYIKKEQPGAQMFEDLSRTRERILSKLHISAPTRGEIKTSTATTNQIARESDFTVADDLSALTINEVATKMAEALLHMMKLRYTPEHFERLIGKQGETVQQRLTADIIEDGLEVTIKASGTDKLKAERQAKEESQIGLGDPVSYYEDTGRPDPEDRAEKSFLFNTAPELYYKQFIQKQDIKDIAENVIFQNRQIQQQVGQPQSGSTTINTQPMAPSPQNTGNIPTVPQGSPRGLIGKATQAIGSLFAGR